MDPECPGSFQLGANAHIPPDKIAPIAAGCTDNSIDYNYCVCSAV